MEEVFHRVILVKTGRQEALRNFQDGPNKLQAKTKKRTLHNPYLGYFVQVDKYPSLQGKISSRFVSFFAKFKHKLIFQDQDIYKVALARLPRVLQMILHFCCAGIVKKEDLGNMSLSGQITRRMSLGVGERSPKLKKAKAKPSNYLNTPKRKPTGKFQIDSQTKGQKPVRGKSQSKVLRLFEEFTFVVQPFLCFIYSLHRIIFFLDIEDKAFLFKHIVENIKPVLQTFYSCQQLQEQLYMLRDRLDNPIQINPHQNDSRLENAEREQKDPTTRNVMNFYNNQGFEQMKKQTSRSKRTSMGNQSLSLKSLSSFPYLLSLLVDLENLFQELKTFDLSMDQETFFERMGLISDEKVKNRSRMHRLLLVHHKSLFMFKLSLAQNFVGFSKQMKSEDKTMLLEILQNFYLASARVVIPSISTPYFLLPYISK